MSSEKFIDGLLREPLTHILDLYPKFRQKFQQLPEDRRTQISLAWIGNDPKALLELRPILVQCYDRKYFDTSRRKSLEQPTVVYQEEVPRTTTSRRGSTDASKGITPRMTPTSQVGNPSLTQTPTLAAAPTTTATRKPNGIIDKVPQHQQGVTLNSMTLELSSSMLPTSNVVAGSTTMEALKAHRVDSILTTVPSEHSNTTCSHTCDNCKEVDATILCDEHQMTLCEECDSDLHRRGATLNHNRVYINSLSNAGVPPMRVPLPVRLNASSEVMSDVHTMTMTNQLENYRFPAANGGGGVKPLSVTAARKSATPTLLNAWFQSAPKSNPPPPGSDASAKGSNNLTPRNGNGVAGSRGSLRPPDASVGSITINSQTATPRNTSFATAIPMNVTSAATTPRNGTNTQFLGVLQQQQQQPITEPSHAPSTASYALDDNLLALLQKKPVPSTSGSDPVEGVTKVVPAPVLADPPSSKPAIVRRTSGHVDPQQGTEQSTLKSTSYPVPQPPSTTGRKRVVSVAETEHPPPAPQPATLTPPALKPTPAPQQPLRSVDLRHHIPVPRKGAPEVELDTFFQQLPLTSSFAEFLIRFPKVRTALDSSPPDVVHKFKEKWSKRDGKGLPLSGLMKALRGYYEQGYFDQENVVEIHDVVSDDGSPTRLPQPNRKEVFARRTSDTTKLTADTLLRMSYEEASAKYACLRVDDATKKQKMVGRWTAPSDQFRAALQKLIDDGQMV